MLINTTASCNIHYPPQDKIFSMKRYIGESVPLEGMNASIHPRDTDPRQTTALTTLHLTFIPQLRAEYHTVQQVQKTP